MKNFFDTTQKKILAAIVFILIIAIIVVTLILCLGGNSANDQVKSLIKDLENGNLSAISENLYVQDSNSSSPEPLMQSLATNSSFSSDLNNMNSLTGSVKNLASTLNYSIVSSTVTGNVATIVINANWYSINTIKSAVESISSLPSTNIVENANALANALANVPNGSTQNYYLQFTLNKINGKWHMIINQSLRNQFISLANKFDE